VVNKVPDEEPKPEPVKASKAVEKLLKACCIVELIDKWQFIKNRNATCCGKRFKIEPAFEKCDVQLWFYDDDGNLSRPVRAKEVFMDFEKKDKEDFIELGKDICNRAFETCEPLMYVKGSFDAITKIRARMSDTEKKWLNTKLTAFEQTKFYYSQPEWSGLK